MIWLSPASMADTRARGTPVNGLSTTKAPVVDLLGRCAKENPGLRSVPRLAKLLHAKNNPLSLFWQSPNLATGPLPRESLARHISSQIPSSHPGTSSVMIQLRLEVNKYRVIVKPLLKHSQHKPQVDIHTNTHHKGALNFRVHDTLVKNTTPPPGGGIKRHLSL